MNLIFTNLESTSFISLLKEEIEIASIVFWPAFRALSYSSLKRIWLEQLKDLFILFYIFARSKLYQS